MKGTLSEGVLLDVLQEIREERRTGLLHVLQGVDRRSLRFRAGQIVHGQSARPEEHLGEVLVRQGLLSRPDLERADVLVRRDGKRLGRALVDLGILDHAGLEDAVALHGREVLLSVFARGPGSYAFEEEAEAPLNEEATLRLPTGNVVLEVARRLQDPEAVRWALGDLDRVLAPSTDPFLRLQKFTLTPVDGFVLSRIDGTLKGSEVIQLVSLPPEDTRKSLFALLCGGVIRVLPRPSRPVRRSAPAPPPPPPPRDAQKPSPQPSPTPRTDKAPADVPVAADPESVALRAEEALHEAQKLMSEEKYWDAIRLLEETVPASQGRMQKRAQILLARAYLKNPNWVRRAEDLLLGMIRENPDQVEAFVILGTMYKESGLPARAAAMFRKALEIEPAHDGALAELRAVDPQSPPPGGSLLKKLLKNRDG